MLVFVKLITFGFLCVFLCIFIALSNSLWPGLHTAMACRDLTGNWRNQLGSNMTIQTMTDTGRISGQYYTAVESTEGAATLASNLSGMVLPVEEGSLVAFTVVYNKGESLAAWVGQCTMRDGKEVIHTTWVLRSQEEPADNWKTTRVNRDTFRRVDGPVPQQNGTSGLNVKTENLTGTWISSTMDKFKITDGADSGVWNGIYYDTHWLKTKENPIFGFLDGNETYFALGFVSGSTNHRTIQGWVGHINDVTADSMILETSWLQHDFVAPCDNPRTSVHFGMDNYTLETADIMAKTQLRCTM